MFHLQYRCKDVPARSPGGGDKCRDVGLLSDIMENWTVIFEQYKIMKEEEDVGTSVQYNRNDKTSG